jgi:FemAB-related protein (PEP-CTERM system-associated)
VELLNEFYAVFSQNMRDLGTPVFSRRLFQSILRQFPEDAELCVVRLDRRPVAAALLVHGECVTEVPSASSLRAYNSLNANMLMYWHLLQRAIQRGQAQFDFGRSTVDGNTFRFKKQWGAKSEPAVWQYYVRKGDVGDMRLENGKYDRMVRIWQRLPVGLTRLVGPWVVRGIP